MQPLIELSAITRTFGAFTALSGITLSLPQGRIGLLGPNGAGTSTLLKILIGFMPEADALVPGLSGVEYVSLAGELYGMPHRDAVRRAHEVLSYLELEEARYRR